MIVRIGQGVRKDAVMGNAWEVRKREKVVSTDN